MAKGRSSKKTAKWQGNRRGGMRRAVLIAAAGVVAIAVVSVLQSTSLFQLNREEDTSSLRINELVSENLSSITLENGDAPDWVEIINAGDKLVNLKGYSLVLGDSIDKMYAFPAKTLAPEETVVVYCEGSSGIMGDLSAPFKLAASGDETLLLMNAAGSIVDSVQTVELNADCAYCRIGENEWAISLTATPGEENSVTSEQMNGNEALTVVPGELEITEVMSANTLYDRGSDGRCSDYVEIRNISDGNVDLEGWMLSDDTQKPGRWVFPSKVLTPGEYAVVYCCGENSADASELRADFKISSDGETVCLTSPEYKTVSMVRVPALNKNQSYSCVNGTWTADLGPTPGLANTRDNANAVTAKQGAANTTGVVINEIMASPTSENSDWVELYNSTNEAVDISGWGLSDDAARPRKYQFPQGTVIAPGEYMGIFFSGTEGERLNGYLNVNFALSANGGYTMSLSQPDGTVLESVFVPQQYSKISYGRVDGREGFCFFETSTPGHANSGACYVGRAEAAVYSVEGGLYNTGDVVTVELSAPVGSRIYYTLDSSDPDEEAVLYTEPIKVTGTSVIRSMVYAPDCMPSTIESHTYLFDASVSKKVYVISLVTDNSNLYDANSGIFTFPYKDWEREAHAEIFSSDGEKVISQRCGIKVHGSGSRKNPIVSLKIKAGGVYDHKYFEYKIFEKRDYCTFDSLILRVGGQDYNKTMMRDSVLQKLAYGTSLEYLESEVCVVYLNGEYYALADIREPATTHTICNFEGWRDQEDDIDFGAASFGTLQGECTDYEELVEWLKTAKGTDQEIYDIVSTQIDIQNYIEYMAIQIFIGNWDPKNVKRYRNNNADGKWHWLLYDLDWGFASDRNSVKEWMNPEGIGKFEKTDTTLWIALMNNSVFFDEFSTYFGEMLATTFATEHVISMFEERYCTIETLIPDYLMKINVSAEKYRKNVKALLVYAVERPQKVIDDYIDCYNLSDADTEKYFGEAIRVGEQYAASHT